MKTLFYSVWGGEPQRKSDGAAAYDLCAFLLNDTHDEVATIKAKDNKNKEIRLLPRFVDMPIDAETTKTRAILTIPPRHRAMVPTGLYLAPLTDDEKMFFGALIRSGTGWDKGILLPNGVGVIDQDYRGQLFLVVFNPLDCDVEIFSGERIAHFIALPYMNIEWERVNDPKDLPPSERGTCGFGSTGK